MLRAMKRRTLPLLALAVLAGAAHANPPAQPYDEAADAAKALQQALDAGARSKRPVLVIFGANWCGDCRALDIAMKSPANAGLVDKEFVVLKVDVGRFNKHLDVVERTGATIKKGIPAAAVLSPQGKLLYATQAGELANAREMSERGVYDFFAEVVAKAGRSGG
jgi:thioredoxin 1